MAVESTNGDEVEESNNTKNGSVSENQPSLDLSDEELQQCTRISRKVFDILKSALEPSLAGLNSGGDPTPVDIQLCAALKFLADGKHECQVGSINNLPRTVLERFIENVVDCLVELAPQFIKFPTIEEFADVKQRFLSVEDQNHKVGFPNVIGIIDCSHIHLQEPESHADLYLNCYSQHSINVQFVCGPDLQIYNVFAAFPGGKNDGFIWKNSNLRHVLAGSNLNDCWLIADIAYPQEPWLMTPILAPETPGENLYNTVHTVTRKPVERCLGILKTRSGCLQSILEYSPERVCAITIACCVLHNICVKYDDMQINPDLKEPPDALKKEEAVSVASMEEGVAARSDLIQNYFLC